MSKFVYVSRGLLIDEQVSWQAKALYALLLLLATDLGRTSEDEGQRLPPLDEIAALLGAEKSKLSRYLKELRDAGWIATQAGGGKRTLYFIFDAAQVVENSERPRAGASMSKSRAKSKELLPSVESPGDAASTRKRDPLFDAIAAATDSDPHFEGTRIGKAVSAFRKHPDFIALDEKEGRDAANIAAAAAVKEAAAAYRRVYPGMPCTLESLFKHFKRVRILDATRQEGEQVGALLPEPGAALEMIDAMRSGAQRCPECNGEGVVAAVVARVGDTEALEETMPQDSFLRESLERMKKARPPSLNEPCPACGGSGNGPSLDQAALPEAVRRAFRATGGDWEWRTTSNPSVLRGQFLRIYGEFRREALAGSQRKELDA